jgi:hypothetical protein
LIQFSMMVTSAALKAVMPLGICAPQAAGIALREKVAQWGREGRAMGVAPPSARVSKPTGFERTVTLQIR